MKKYKYLIIFFSFLILLGSARFCFAATSTNAIAPNQTIPKWDMKIDIPTLGEIVKIDNKINCERVNNQTVCYVPWLSNLLIGLINYGMSLLGILATLTMMFGGFLWLTAGGDAGQVKKAQKYIKSSVIGVILALTSYTILYQINPDLLIFKNLKIIKPDYKIEPTAGDTCDNYKRVNGNDTKNFVSDKGVIDFTKYVLAETSSVTALPTYCSSSTVRNLFKGVGNDTDQNNLIAISAVETGCGFNKQKSSAGACGIMQIMPSTAIIHKDLFNQDDGFPVKAAGTTDEEHKNNVCNWLITHDKQSIRIAHEYIKANSSRHNNELEKIFAGYNSGYGTSGSGGLAKSKDCPNALKYQCCIDPQELIETQNYVLKALTFRNYIKPL